MRIVFFTDNINETASGIVAAQIVNGFVKASVEIFVVARVLKNISNETTFKYHQIAFPFLKMTSVEKLSFIVFNRELKHKNIIQKRVRELEDEIKNFEPDRVFSLAAGDAFYMVEIANEISKRLSIPIHHHTVDAIPAPSCWGENKFFRDAKIKLIKRLFSPADIVSATNAKMLDYQLRMINRKPGESTFVLPNPIDEQFIESIASSKKRYVLYLGTLSPNKSGRNGLQYFKAIEKLADTDLDFYFVGTNLHILTTYSANNELPSNVHHVQWTSEVDNYIKNAALLVDIDINAQDDVFMSSKLIRYMNTDIPIVNISFAGSAARDLLSNQNTGAICVDHESSRITKAIKEALALKVNIDTRKNLIRPFMIEAVIKGLLEKYQLIR